jgi:ketosteroid isomerase-like protein
VQGISDGAWKDLHSWFSEDAVVQYPFALPLPTQLEGIEVLKKYFAAVSAYPMRLKTQNMVVHETSDPEVVVAEWDYDGVVTTTGQTFRASNITVTRVRDGKIVASRDYHNHAVLAGAIGRLASLAEILTTSSTPPTQDEKG